MANTHPRRISSKSRSQTSSRQSLELDALEDRRLLAVPAASDWVPYAQIIGQAQAAIAYPYLDGSNQDVAVIDRGVDYNLPQIGAAKIGGGYNFRDSNGNILDDYGHGTGTSGIIAANPYELGGYNQGVATNTHIVMLKQESSANIKAALDWVIAYHSYYNIQVVNLTDFITDVLPGTENPSLYTSELATLKTLNIFVTTPVGNGEIYALNNGGTHAPIVEPSFSAFAVGGSTLDDTMYPDSRRGQGLQLLAPADHVTMTYYLVNKNPDGSVATPGYDQYDDQYNGTGTLVNYAVGTSWASAYTAGTAALLKQINPNFTVDQIANILTSTGTPVADNENPAVTYPRLNVYAALTKGFQMSDDADFGNQSFANATKMPFSKGKSTLTNLKLTIGHPDFYAFTVTKTSTVKINLTDATDSPFSVLFDQNHNVVKQLAYGKKGNSQKLTAGTYYVYLTSPTTLQGTYSLAISGSSNVVVTPAAVRANSIITPAAAFGSSPITAATSSVLDPLKNSVLG